MLNSPQRDRSLTTVAAQCERFERGLDADREIAERCQKRRTCSVRYFGGSKPGAERQLRPISVRDGKVRALCMETGATKLFVIDKMEGFIDGVPSAMVAVQLAAPTTFPSLEDFTARHRGDFEAYGWVVQQGPQALSLHRTFKDGKVVRSPLVDLSFDAETYDVMLDGEQLTHENHRSRAAMDRPWQGHDNEDLRGFGESPVGIPGIHEAGRRQGGQAVLAGIPCPDAAQAVIVARSRSRSVGMLEGLPPSSGPGRWLCPKHSGSPYEATHGVGTAESA